MMVGVLALIVFGAAIAYYGYQTAIYPIDSTLGYLARAETSQTPKDLASYIVKAQAELPQNGNPVWSFPTAKTDFGLIQKDLSDILSRANSISSMEPYSTEYNTGMEDMHASLKTLQDDLEEAIPYIYVSFTNIVLGAVWIAIILGMFAIIRRGRARFKEEEYEDHPQ
jgi:hypothetical protein